MNKTIKQWLTELPEPHRTRALDNYDERGDEYTIYVALETVVCAAFSWHDTPEGVDYWDEISQGNYDAEPTKTMNETNLLLALKYVVNEAQGNPNDSVRDICNEAFVKYDIPLLAAWETSGDNSIIFVNQ
jgi:hypothetical protein